MSIQQKCESLASAVGTQFVMSVLYEETHSNTNIFKSQTNSGERKKNKKRLALWAKTAEKFKYILFPRYLMETLTFFHFRKNTQTYINFFFSKMKPLTKRNSIINIWYKSATMQKCCGLTTPRLVCRLAQCARVNISLTTWQRVHYAFFNL